MRTVFIHKHISRFFDTPNNQLITIHFPSLINLNAIDADEGYIDVIWFDVLVDKRETENSVACRGAATTFMIGDHEREKS